MPYIPQDKRDALDIDACRAGTPGELNYVITKLLDEFLRGEGFNYTNINAAIGVLECAKLELYRRLAAPYEEIKKAQNGDVYKTKVPGFVRAAGENS